MGPDWDEEHKTGTSIMAVVFQDGVVVGADSRTTTGAYIANRTSDKLTPIHDKIYCCRSGAAADTQAIADYVTWFLNMHAVELGEEPQVVTAANLFKQLCYANKNHIMAAIIVGGYDKQNRGSVYSIPLGGSLVREPWAIGGSGSSYIYGYCDSNYKSDMTKEEALTFVQNALSLAMARDGSSGGLIRTVVITADGVERGMLPGNKLPKFYQD
jgi:20S proteasome subunit beta 1